MRRIKEAGTHELEIRKSRFICALARVSGEEQATAFIGGRRRAFRDASHNCTAYVLGEYGEIAKSSDDGEPAGTAGIPMLEVLLRRELTGVAAVVTRYFGGIKLGAGGLVRAYGQAVAEAIDAVGVVELLPVVAVTVSTDHARAGRFLSDLHASPTPPRDVRYDANVHIEVLVPEVGAAAFAAWVAELSAGSATVELGARSYAEVDL